MLTTSEINLVPSMLLRTYASRALEVVKMSEFVPCEVDDKRHHYKNKIIEVVFDPLRVPEINARFRAAGYDFTDKLQVIAVTEDGSILLWGLVNSIFHLPKGERIDGPFDRKHLAFTDILDLTNRFKIKNKKVELDDLIAKLQSAYRGLKS